MISLMTLALAGITIIQILWISNAIREQEKEFEVRVNSALNSVNHFIEEKETDSYLYQNFGDIDSMVNELILIHESDDKSGEVSNDSAFVVVHDHAGHTGTSAVRLTIRNDVKSVDIENDSTRLHFTRSIELADSGRWVTHAYDDTGKTVIHDERIEMRINGFEHDAALLESTLKHKTFKEIFRNKEIHERINRGELEDYVEESFKDQGLENKFEFGVYNKLQQEYDDSLQTDGFDKGQPEFVFAGNLFNGNFGSNKFDLVLHLDNQSVFVWSQVKPMIWLSVLFTLLILVCFGYSIYFIFKQKKIGQIKDDFVNNMTHELKTPLATISLAADSIIHPDVIGNREEITHFVDMIKNEEDRMNSQIEKVLEIATLENGSLALRKAPVNLIDVINKSLQHHDLVLNSAGGHCVFESDVKEAMIEGDELHLINVFNNLIDNSIKYRSDRDLKISIDLYQKGNDYLIKIADNGIGVNKKTLSLAFDKFYREEGGNVHTVKGYGLGLTYVKKVVELHGGEVSILNNDDYGVCVQLILQANEG